jgi:hypothetical protein
MEFANFRIPDSCLAWVARLTSHCKNIVKRFGAQAKRIKGTKSGDF